MTYLLGVFAFFIFYLAAINVVNAYKSNRLPLPTKIVCAPIVGVFYVVDVVLNWTLCIPLFMDLPKERTITRRLNRLANSGGWRQTLARTIAKYAVNPFDLTEVHVEYPGAREQLSQAANN